MRHFNNSRKSLVSVIEGKLARQAAKTMYIESALKTQCDKVMMIIIRILKLHDKGRILKDVSKQLGFR